jgi:hypothetical protein
VQILSRDKNHAAWRDMKISARIQIIRVNDGAVSDVTAAINNDAIQCAVSANRGLWQQNGIRQGSTLLHLATRGHDRVPDVAGDVRIR